MPYDHARTAGPRRVILSDSATDEELIREGGSSGWRNANPIGLSAGTFATAYGAVGDDGTFAIFPDETIGWSACVELLATPAYSQRSVGEIIQEFAVGPIDAGDEIADLARRSGLEAARSVSSLSEEEMRRLAGTVKDASGWAEGMVRVDKPNKSRPTRTAARSAQDWMRIAKGEAALPARERTEWDPGDNPRIMQYFRSCREVGPGPGGDEIDWCAAFCNHCLEAAGYLGTSHVGSRSFYHNRHNRFRRLSRPAYGCLAVFRNYPFDKGDTAWATGRGHVGFLLDWDEDKLWVLGGNQLDTVRTLGFPYDDSTRTLYAYMMPAGN
jgi:uncharacterized protein (TIGR02594 family)